MAKADFCGTASGRKVDKASLFKDPESLPDLPLIEDCPVNLACEVVDISPWSTAISSLVRSSRPMSTRIALSKWMANGTWRT